MKLFFIIAGKTVFGQMVTGQMSLTGMEQVDCAEDLLPCNGITCSWNCNIEGSVGSEQKICKSTCEDDERIYTARCSCVEMFGPIQIAAPCKWKHWKAPVCEIPTTTSTTKTTTSTTTTTTEEQTEPPKPRWVKVTVKPQQEKSEKSSGTFHRVKDLYQASPRQEAISHCDVLPSEESWSCDNPAPIHGTICRTRCNQQNFRNKCICNRGTCSWRKEMPPCLTKTEDTSFSMLNDFSSQNIFAAFEETENEIIEAEEDDLDRLESVTSNDLNDLEDDSSMGQVLNFMKYMIQENQNLYEKILSFLQNYLV